MSRRASRYSNDELTALAEGYEELRCSDNKAWILVRLVDLDRAYKYLNKDHRRAVLLVGMLGYSTRAAADILGISHTTVAHRYNAGLERMESYLNGDTLFPKQKSTGGKRHV